LPPNVKATFSSHQNINTLDYSLNVFYHADGFGFRQMSGSYCFDEVLIKSSDPESVKILGHAPPVATQRKRSSFSFEAAEIALGISSKRRRRQDRIGIRVIGQRYIARSEIQCEKHCTEERRTEEHCVKELVEFKLDIEDDTTSEEKGPIGIVESRRLAPFDVLLASKRVSDLGIRNLVGLSGTIAPPPSPRNPEGHFVKLQADEHDKIMQIKQDAEDSLEDLAATAASSPPLPVIEYHINK